MTQIGHLTRTADGFAGTIRTLTLDIALCLVPVHSDAENAPDYRLHLGSDDQGPDVGAGWKRTGERAGAYVSLVIDDPAMPRPIHANLFQSAADGRDHHLLWNRASRRRAQD